MEKQNLYEVSFIRSILIVLLVAYHSFAIYSGAWIEPDGIVGVTSYGWIARSSYAFMLETFVLISGYLWAYQRESLGKLKGFFQTIVNKFDRLIIPCLVFGVLYVCIFEGYSELRNNLLSLWGGVGHLWFLPMLFWCFVLGYPIVNIKCKLVLKFSSLLLLVLGSILSLPFALSTAFYYLLFLIAGYYLWTFKDNILSFVDKNFSRIKLIIILWVVFAVLFILGSIGMDAFAEIKDNSTLVKILYHITNKYVRVLYSSVGVIAMWLTAIQITQKRSLKEWYVNLGKYCMGVYIFQQFIIKYVIYDTPLAISVGYYWLPWFVFAMALGGSLLLSYTVKKL